MKAALHHITKPFSQRISIDTFVNITAKNLILPFYHTVSRDPKPHFSESTYWRSESQFVDDLGFFTKNFESVDINGLPKAGRQFHLSFDDGMSEMYNVVFPLLQDLDIHATFFINTDFVDNKKMFISHKKSLLQHELKNSAQKRKVLSDFLNEEEFELNQKLSKIKYEAKIDEIAQLLHVDFNIYLNEKTPYLTTSQIIELRKAGHTIGNHGKSHRNFNTLKFEEQKAEIETVNSFLKEIGADELYFCFPYGDFTIKNELFEWMYSEGQIQKSFGISGLKNDAFGKHQHRILMEYSGLSAEEIIKFEYFYYFWKSFLNRNKIRR